MASRYGYSLSQFLDLTEKQLQRISYAIIKQKRNELELQINLAGREPDKFTHPIEETIQAAEVRENLLKNSINAIIKPNDEGG